MRISTSLYFQTGLNSINRQQGELLNVYQQLGSGRRMINPSDDPLAAAQSLTLAQAQSMAARFGDNRAVAMGDLGEEENVLMSMIPQIYGAKTQLLEAANGTLADADRVILAGVFEEMRDSLANLVNSKNSSGQYIFSGSKGNTEPFEKGPDGYYSYKGDQVARNIQVDQTRQISGSDNGVDLFLRPTPGANAFVTSGSSQNTGNGVMGGVNIINASQAAEVSDFVVTYNADTGKLLVQSSGVAGNPTPTLTEVDYDPTAEKNVIDLGHGVTVQLSGELQDGDTFTLENVQEHSGDDSLNILNVLTDVVNALKTPTDGNPSAKANMMNVINGAMQRIDLTYDNVLTVRASVGARMNEIEALNQTGVLQELHLSSELSRLEDLDYYSASMQLEMRTAALEAAALAFKKIQSASLFSANA